MSPITSESSPTERNRIEVVIRKSLSTVSESWGRSGFDDVGPDQDLFDSLDSFAVVELLLQTETDIEKEIGHYVPLANEKILDATASPLRRFGDWVDYVTEAVRHG